MENSLEPRKITEVTTIPIINNGKDCSPNLVQCKIWFSPSAVTNPRDRE